MGIGPTDLTRSLARGAAPIVLSGSLCGLVVYALVAGSPPLYESEAIVSAAPPPLLEQYDRVVAQRSIPRGRPIGSDDTLTSDLGDVRALVATVREHRNPRAAGSEVDLRIDAAAGEIAVVARSHDRHTTRLIANDIAAGIRGVRDIAISRQHTSVQAELRLVAMLARRVPRLRSRADALRARLAALDQLRQTPGGGLTVLRPARIPTEPVAPRVTRDVILATVAGMLAWVTLSRLRTAACSRRRRLRAAAA